MKCTHVSAAQTTYQFFTKLKIEPDVPCLADEIAEPRPDMNIKVAAFTVNEKSIYTHFFMYTSQSFLNVNLFMYHHYMTLEKIVRAR